MVCRKRRMSCGRKWVFRVGGTDSCVSNVAPAVVAGLALADSVGKHCFAKYRRNSTAQHTLHAIEHAKSNPFGSMSIDIPCATDGGPPRPQLENLRARHIGDHMGKLNSTVCTQKACKSPAKR